MRLGADVEYKKRDERYQQDIQTHKSKTVKNWG